MVEELSIRAAHCEITKKEIQSFPIDDIPLLKETSDFFKKMLCDEYKEA